jgi:U3 small nucleolar RNA-associated protein 18
MRSEKTSSAFYEDYGPSARTLRRLGGRKLSSKRAEADAGPTRAFQTEIELEQFVFGTKEHPSAFHKTSNATGSPHAESYGELGTSNDRDGYASLADGSALQRTQRISDASVAVPDVSGSLSESSGEHISLVSSSRRRKLRRSATETTVQRKAFEERLRSQFLALHGLPNWAARAVELGTGQHAPMGITESGERASASLGQIITPLSNLKTDKFHQSPLPSGALPVQRRTDANAAAPSASVISSVGFHPASAHLFFTAGLDKRLRLFHVTEEPADTLRFRGLQENECLHTVCFADMPIYAAGFARGSGSNNGQAIFLTGRRRYFYEYDLAAQRGIKVRTLEALRKERSYERLAVSPNGKLLALVGDDSQVVLLDARTKDYVGCIRVGCGPQSGTASVRVVAFAPDRDLIACAGETSGYVSLYDLRMNSDAENAMDSRPVIRFLDQGTVHCTALSWSPGGRYLATGSDVGVVNIYETQSLPLGPAPGKLEPALDASAASAAPRYSVSNLVTHIDTLAFLPDDQGLLYASRAKRNAARMFHLQAGKTFSNWPTAQTPLHRVWSACFSPGGGFLALGNDRGRALLYRLRCYGPL